MKRHRILNPLLLCAMLVLPLGSARAGSSPVALLTGVTVSRAGASDRVTFAFRSRPAIVHARYVPRSGLVGVSGRPIPVAGSTFLVVVATPASGVDLSGSSPIPTYRGSLRIPARSTRHIREVVRLEDYEGVLRWAIGLDERRPYAVMRQGPLVILDVK